MDNKKEELSFTIMILAIIVSSLIIVHKNKVEGQIVEETPPKIEEVAFDRVMQGNWIPVAKKKPLRKYVLCYKGVEYHLCRYDRQEKKFIVFDSKCDEEFYFEPDFWMYVPASENEN